MYQKQEFREKSPVSGSKAARVKAFIVMAKAARKDPGFIEAAKEFHRYHTGKELKLRADA